MKKLTNKVFLTIFSILSFFLFISIFIYNTQNYREAYSNVYRTITFTEDSNPKGPRPDNIDNMMIMDYEVYTVILDDNEIDRIIYHGNFETVFDIERIAKKILKKEHSIKIGNLYNNKYSYNYMDNQITIINTQNINRKLTLKLISSLIILTLVEIIIYVISNIITKWITKPAIDSYNKQRDFIADASHELKTPLAVIMASSDELKSDKKNAKYIDNIKYESDRMNKLITSLLNLSKLEREEKVYKQENISKIIEKISLTFEAIAYENNISIDTMIEDNINMNCSKEDIEKLISIILDNAIKHSYKKSTIKVITKKNKNNIEIEIINKGNPITPGDEEKIFDRFYRADKSRNRDSNRYGLGLAIAKEIVNNHNGTIKAYSKDKFTHFKIILKN